MCIGNTEYCSLLSPSEQLAQHNFEERKGPYPHDLARRLESAGVMTADEHLKQSVIERDRDALRNFKWGDRTPEETAYINGVIDELPMDPYLTPGNQQLIWARCREMRIKNFVCLITSDRITEALKLREGFELLEMAAQGRLAGFPLGWFGCMTRRLNRGDMPAQETTAVSVLVVMHRLRKLLKIAAATTNGEFEKEGFALPQFLTNVFPQELATEYELLLSSFNRIVALPRKQKRARAKRSLLMTALRKRVAIFLRNALNDTYINAAVRKAIPGLDTLDAESARMAA